MPIIVLKNPKSFARECEGKNITLDLLNEAKMCIGAQTVCKMFIGKSSRGDEGYISASSLDTWIATLNFVKNNPDKEDGDRFSGARMLEKYGDAWDKYVAFIKTPISDETVNSWENLSNVKLGDAASAVGITMGIRNNKAVQSLRTRLHDMVKRRQELFWDLSGGSNSDIGEASAGAETSSCEGGQTRTGLAVIEKVDYKFNNTLTLHKMCKNRGIFSAKLTKDAMIKLLEEDDEKIPAQVCNDINYEKMKISDLKNICKEKKLTNYNKLNKPALINKILSENKNVSEIKEIKNTSIDITQDTSTCTNENKKIKEIKPIILTKKPLVLNDITIEVDPVSMLINATQMCKAAGKLFGHYKSLDSTQTYLQALESNIGIPILELITVDVGGNHSGTFVHRLVAVHLAQWLSPSFAVQVSLWVNEIMITGKVEIGNELNTEEIDNIWKKRVEEQDKYINQINILIKDSPVEERLNRTQSDKEAEYLETNFEWYKYTNHCVLYLAYIGDGLIKLGYSDCGLVDREKKHMSSGNEFDQFRMIAAFNISSRKMETIIKDLLTRYRIKYNKQYEIYKPENTLDNFCKMVESLLKDNDLKYQNELLIKEICRLKEIIKSTGVSV